MNGFYFSKCYNKIARKKKMAMKIMKHISKKYSRRFFNNQDIEQLLPYLSKNIKMPWG